MIQKKLFARDIQSFQKKIYDFYHKHGRALPWRTTTNPYHILVSEIMLQQTQVDRVKQKYAEFIRAFPNVKVLARAPFHKILKCWQGMGYNRRALYLKRIAEIITQKYNGNFPKMQDELKKLPGIGVHTAASICAFAYNQPVVFIETNIRTVFIQEFFKSKKTVQDSEIIPLVEQALDRKNPCKWYNALMDYGVMLKSKNINPSRKSAHYTKQSKFEGSNRQIRGKILKLLTEQSLSQREVEAYIGVQKDIVARNLSSLKTEGFIREAKKRYCITR